MDRAAPGPPPARPTPGAFSMTPRQIELAPHLVRRRRTDRRHRRDDLLSPPVRPRPVRPALFTATDMAGQRRNLMQTLAVVVRGLDRLDTIVPAVEALGRRHSTYGVRPEDFETSALPCSTRSRKASATRSPQKRARHGRRRTRSCPSSCRRPAPRRPGGEPDGSRRLRRIGRWAARSGRRGRRAHELTGLRRASILPP